MDSNSMGKIYKKKYDCFKAFDFFGVNFNFRINNQKHYVSKTGGIWFLIYCILCIAFASVFIYHHISNPLFTVYAWYRILDYSREVHSIKLIREKFNFAIQINEIKLNNTVQLGNAELLTSNSTNISNNSATFQLPDPNNYSEKSNFFSNSLDLGAYYIIEDNKNNRKSIRQNIDIIPCNVQDLISTLKKNKNGLKNSKNNVKDLFCFNITNNMTLNGTRIEDLLSYISLEFTINIKDKGLQDKKLVWLHSFLKNFSVKFSIIHPLLSIESEDYTNYTIKPDSTEATFSYNLYQEIDLIIQRLSYNNDDNLFYYDDLKKYYYSELKDIRHKISENSYIDLNNSEYYKSNKNASFRLGKVNIKGCQIYKKFFRVTSKLLNVLSTIGSGIVNIFVIFSYIFSSINLQKAKYNIVNKIIKVHDDLETSENNNKNNNSQNQVIKKIKNEEFQKIIREFKMNTLSMSNNLEKKSRKKHKNKLKCHNIEEHRISQINLDGIIVRNETDLNLGNYTTDNNINIDNKNHSIFQSPKKFIKEKEFVFKMNSPPKSIKQVKHIKKAKEKVGFEIAENINDALQEKTLKEKFLDNSTTDFRSNSKNQDDNFFINIKQNDIELTNIDIKQSNVIINKPSLQNLNVQIPQMTQKHTDMKNHNVNDNKKKQLQKFRSEKICHNPKKIKVINIIEEYNKQSVDLNHQSGLKTIVELENETSNKNDFQEDPCYDSKSMDLEVIDTPKAVNSTATHIHRNSTDSRLKLLLNKFRFNMREYVCSYINYIFCCGKLLYRRKEKTELFAKGDMKLNQYLDIVHYLRKMQEIDILKYLVLDRDMMTLVNFISRPSINRNDDFFTENKIYFEPQNLNFESIEDIQQLKTSYENISSKFNNKNIEQKLLKLWDQQMKNI